MKQPIPRPGFNEICCIILLTALACTPAMALAIHDTRAAVIVFLFLALSFWFPIGQIIMHSVRKRKSEGVWEWPRLVGGPSINFHFSKRQA